MNSQKVQNDTIDLMVLMQLVKDKLVWILLSAILFGGVGYVISAFALTPKYEASINMIVNNQNPAAGLVDTYAVVIKSNTVLDQVIEDMGLEKNYGTLYSQVDVSSVNGTRVMKISVQDADLKLACEIVEKIANISADQVAKVVEAGSCKIVGDIYTTGTPVYPNTQRNVLKAAILGACICAGLFILRYLMDNTFESEEDIENKLDLPVLGVIPAIERCGRRPSKAKTKEKS